MAEQGRSAKYAAVLLRKLKLMAEARIGATSVKSKIMNNEL